MKNCSKCKQGKELSEFHKQKDRKNGLGLKSECKECTKEYRQKYYLKHQEREINRAIGYRSQHKEQIKNNYYKRKYGLTTNTIDQMFAAQGQKCAICKSTESKSKHSWHTDHDHKTDKVRGILCQPCNMSLAKLENLEWKKLAEEYLQLYG